MLSVAFPGLRSKEVGIVVLHSAFLILRTILSVYVAKLDGHIVKNLVRPRPSFSLNMTSSNQVSADGPGFLRGLGLWFALAVPSTYTNSMVGQFRC